MLSLYNRCISSKYFSTSNHISILIILFKSSLSLFSIMWLFTWASISPFHFLLRLEYSRVTVATERPHQHDLFLRHLLTARGIRRNSFSSLRSIFLFTVYIIHLIILAHKLPQFLLIGFLLFSFCPLWSITFRARSAAANDHWYYLD